MPPTPYQILANPPQRGPSLHPYFGPWLRQGLLPYLATIGGGSPVPGAVVAFVSPYPGNVAATGTEGDPFNPTSAAAGFGGDPFGQAVASFAPPTSAADEERARCIFALGGTYPNPVNMATGAIRRCYIIGDGPAFVSGGFWVHNAQPSAWGNTFPHEFGIISLGFYECLSANPGPLALLYGDNGAGENIGCYCTGAVGIDLDSSGAPMAGQLQATFNVCRVRKLHAPAPLQSSCEAFFSTILGPVDWNRLGEFTACNLSGVWTIDSASIAAEGFRACFWRDPGGPVVFNGPAGAARFDSGTLASFLQNPGGFSWGVGLAGPMDTTDPPRFSCDAVADTVAGPGVVTLEWAIAQASIWSDLRVVVDTVPAPGPCFLTLTLGGAPILPAPFDLSTLAPGVVTFVPLIGLVTAATGDALTATISGPGIAGGDRVRLVLLGRAAGFQFG